MLETVNLQCADAPTSLGEQQQSLPAVIIRYRGEKVAVALVKCRRIVTAVLLKKGHQAVYWKRLHYLYTNCR